MYKVFLVEDEYLVRESLRMQVAGLAEFQVCGEAEDGEQALQQIRRCQPDIVMTDIKMQFMSGLELARTVRKSQPEIHFLIISGYDEFEFAREALQLGVDDYLLKPVDAGALSDALYAIAEKIELERQTGQGKDPEREKELKRAEFLESLAAGNLSVAEAWEGAGECGVNLDVERFAAAELQIDFAAYGVSSPRERRNHIREILESTEDLYGYLKGSDRAVLIAGGSDPDEIRHRIYRAAERIKQALRADGEVRVTAGIGETYPRISGISRSFADAHKTLSLLLGTGQDLMMGIHDFEQTFSGSGYTPIVLKDRLMYSVEEDAETLADEWIRQAGMPCSLIYLYYRLTDFLNETARILGIDGEEKQELLAEALQGQDLIQVIQDSGSLPLFVTRVLTLAIRNLRSREEKPNEIIRAKLYLREHYREADCSLNMVAEAVGFSSNHFSMIFSSRTGQTFIEYLTGLRIRKAKELLRQGVRPTDIAWEIGYTDERYFLSLFKKNTGMTTREFLAREKE